MTTGEKLALLRKKKGMTQEELAEILKVSRQSVSRWEMDIAFPETEKLIKLSKLFECSIDFLLDENTHKSEESCMDTSVDECYKFIRDCGYFFLATSVDNQPKLRPFGMIYSNGKGVNLGYFGKSENKDIAEKLRKAFASWINNGHNNFADENTCILCIQLSDGVLFNHGKRYHIDFTAK